MPLILTRKKGETIKIGYDVFVTIQRISGKQVHLLIEAPNEVSIMRTELLTRERVTDDSRPQA